jgi:hypothetical protein
MTLEAKKIDLQNRWLASQRKKMIKSVREQVATLRKKDPSPTKGQGKQGAGKVMMEGLLSDSEKKGSEDLKKLQHDEDIKDLMTPILWFNKVAVGQSRTFRGWWMVVPPTGYTISYNGQNAKELAISQAITIQSWYD